MIIRKVGPRSASMSMDTNLKVTVVLLLLSSTFLSACEPGRIFNPAPTPSPTRTPTPAARPVILECGEWARIDVGDYQAYNNPWNKGEQSEWSQCIGLGHASDGTIMGRWTWDWPYSDHVVSYPMIFYGRKPPSSTSNDILPVAILDIGSATVSYDISSTHTGQGNLALEFWLYDTQNPQTWSVPPITHEIMIWLEAYGGMRPAGRLFGRVTIQNNVYQMYIADNFAQGQRYIAFASETSQLGEGRLNLHDFLWYLRENGFVTGEEYLGSIEIGNEIRYGVGETIVDEYEVSIQPK